MKKHSQIIVKGAFFMFLGISVKTSLNFLRNIIIGRSLGPSALGTFSLANTIFLVSSTVSVFGLYNTINKFAPAYRVSKDNNSLLRLIGTSIKYTIFTSITWTFLILILSPFFANFFSDNDLTGILRILIIGLPFFTLLRIFMAIATSYETTKLQALVENTLLPITTMISLIIFIKLGKDSSSIPLAFLVGYIFSFVSTVILSRFTRIKEISILNSLSYFDKKYLIFAAPLFANSVLFLLMRWFDTLALGYFSSSKEVGIYNATLTIATIPTLLLTALNTIFFPTISRLISTKKTKEAQNSYKSAIRILSFLTIPFVIFAIIFSKEILLIFGKDFQISSILMLILALGSFFNVFSGPVDLTLTAFDKQKLIPFNSLFALILNIILNIVLIPQIGIIGAAIASTVSLLTQNYLGIIELYHLKNFSPYNLKMLLSPIFGVVIAILGVILKLKTITFHYEDLSLICQIGYLCVGACITYLFFLTIIYLMKLYEKQDEKLIRTIILKIKNGKEQ